MQLFINFQNSFETFIFKTMPFEAKTYIIIVIYQLFETISCGGLITDRMHRERINKVSSKHLYLNNALENNDLYYYRNLSIIWNDLTRSCNNHIHFETFFSIETLFSHIFFGFQLPDFWCASDDYQILFFKISFFDKKWNFCMITLNEYDYLQKT